MTINEPTDPPRPASVPVPPGKGKKKVPKPILESSDENDTNFLLLDSLPIPCHLFYGDDNFKYTPTLNSDFFRAKSECSTSKVNSVVTSNYSSGIILLIYLSLLLKLSKFLLLYCLIVRLFLFCRHAC